MKIRIYLIVTILLALCVTGILFASYDTTPRPKASPDLIEFIIKVPLATYEKHGYSERTDILYNLIWFKERYIEYTKQKQMLDIKIKLLEDKVSKLEMPPVSTATAHVPDANSVE